MNSQPSIGRRRWTDRKFLMCILAFVVYTAYVFVHPSDTAFGIYTASVVALFGWFAKVSVDEKKN